MQLTQKHRDQFVVWFCILFYVLMLYKFMNGLFLFQLSPIIYTTRFDIVTWVLMQTGIHTWLLNNKTGWLLFDVIFYLTPALYLVVYQLNKSAATVFAACMLVINFVYIQCYTLYPANSIESFTAWLLFPVLMMTSCLGSFYFVMHGLRYFILFVLVSAGIWKFVQSGIFNPEEMSGILLYQHKDYLATSPENIYSKSIYWLINHPSISYLLYLCATVLELSFLIGFFTKRFDKYLILLFILFLFMDLLVMRIPYWELSPFVLTLIYSHLDKPFAVKQKT